ALGADYAGPNPGKALNLLHLFFGVGAIVSPLIVSFTQSIWQSWRPVFGIIGALPIIVNLILLTLPIKPLGNSATVQGASPYRSLFLWTMGLTAFVYVGIEVSSYGWLPSLWKSLFKTGIIPPILTSTIFWLALTLGRFFTGRIADRMGLSRFLASISVGVLIMTVIWWATVATSWSIGVVFILGLFLAGVYPTIMAVVAVRFPGRTGEISAFVSIFSSLGGALIPSGIGRIADLVDITELPLLIGGLALILIMGAFAAWRFNNREA
ncbi:MAG TPA: MFS transporter, partial [Bacillota bacterium]|nr:MFS transporter [Bacillota bacterium]